MRIKSDLSIQELSILLHGINLRLGECANILKMERRKAILAMTFAPWLRKKIATNLAYNTSLVLDHAFIISKLREKLMKAEGLGERGVPITLQEFYANSEDA